ncbi:hypothetical protein G6L67_00295 [Agrobacterium tumefaciens]|nr:hypothetical protein [Agrobacterium tumefaciens]
MKNLFAVATAIVSISGRSTTDVEGHLTTTQGPPLHRSKTTNTKMLLKLKCQICAKGRNMVRPCS